MKVNEKPSKITRQARFMKNSIKEAAYRHPIKTLSRIKHRSSEHSEHAESDTNCLIVSRTIEESKTRLNVVVVAQDNDQRVLLTSKAPINDTVSFFRPISHKSKETLNISRQKYVLGSICVLLSAHSIEM